MSACPTAPLRLVGILGAAAACALGIGKTPLAAEPAASTSQKLSCDFPPERAAAVGQSDPDSSSASEWENRAHAALRRESSTKGAEQEKAARDLIGLYQSLEQAQGIDKHERTELRRVLRNRLARIGQRIAMRLKKSETVPAASATAARAAAPVPIAPVSTIGKRPKQVRPVAPLAQRLPAAANAPVGLAPAASRQRGDLTSAMADLIRHVIAGNSWVEPAPAAQQMDVKGQVLGAGVAGMLGRGQGGRPLPADHGQELVELIQRTIAPGTWDSNGGNGTIMYYAPQRAIVVRQTDEIHDDLGRLLGAMRD